MKLIQTYALLFAIICLRTASAQSLVSNQERDVKALFTADILLVKEDSVAKITSKYNGMSSAAISFNRQQAVLTVHKAAPDCKSDSLCDASSAPEVVVNFQIKAFAFSGCFEHYYAQAIEKNSAMEKEIKEEIWIKRYMSEVCQSIAPVEDGQLIYKITGPSLETGVKTFGAAKAILENMEFSLVP